MTKSISGLNSNISNITNTLIDKQNKIKLNQSQSVTPSAAGTFNLSLPSGATYILAIVKTSNTAYTVRYAELSFGAFDYLHRAITVAFTVDYLYI